MPRHSRIYAPGLFYHLMARGNNGQAVFVTAADYAACLTTLQTIRERYPFSLESEFLCLKTAIGLPARSLNVVSKTF